MYTSCLENVGSGGGCWWCWWLLACWSVVSSLRLCVSCCWLLDWLLIAWVLPMNFSFCSLMIKPKRFRDLRSDFSLNTSKKLALRLSVGLNTPRRLAPQPIGKKKNKKTKVTVCTSLPFHEKVFLSIWPWMADVAVVGRGNAGWTTSEREWTSLSMPKLLSRASCRKDWKRISAESFLMSLRRPNGSRDRTELNHADDAHFFLFLFSFLD